jgi:hypothetical protein
MDTFETYHQVPMITALGLTGFDGYRGEWQCDMIDSSDSPTLVYCKMYVCLLFVFMLVVVA